MLACILLGGLLSIVLARSLPAQDADGPALRVPWAQTAGFSFVSESGVVRSFFADATRLIADEAGFDVRFVQYGSPAEVIAAMRDGRADLLTGVGQLPVLKEGNLFSRPIAETRFLLHVRSDAPNDWTIENFAGRRIGVLRGTAASRMTPPEGATLVAFEDQITAFGKLLVGEIDGVVVLNALGERTLRNAGIEGLVRQTFPAVSTHRHHVALSRDHAELMPRIEAAIDRLEASGALEDLRGRWFMVPPVPIPDVLTVGVTNFPPYQVVTEDGEFTGFSVELLRELAARSDIRLRFENVTLESWTKGPRADAFDLLPARSINEEEKQWLQFSLPVQTIEYATFVVARNAAEGFDPGDSRIGILAASPIRNRVAEELGTTLIPIADAPSGADALRNGEIDALIFPSVVFASHIAAERGEDDFTRLDEPVFRNQVAVVMRPGLGDLKRRLDVVISGFLGTSEYRRLARTWFEEPPFWTAARVRLLLSGAAAVVILGAGGFLLQNWRARRVAERLRAETVAANERLSAILTNTRHAIFGFDARGDIAVINPSGRALLALDDDAGPRGWPAQAEFLDPVNGLVLDRAEDPLCRALRGDMSNGLVYLFRPDPDRKPRFVRVSSDRVADPRTALRALMIVEDDHDNELTRRKLDRSHRLSSMGLLTGGLAHDFNNILGTVLYNAQLARMTAEGSTAKVLDRIVAAVGQGSDLTRRLLGFARRAPQAPSAVNLAASLRELESLARPTIGEAVTLDLPEIEEDLYAYCDSGELENALLNLVLNARDAINESGQGDRVTIRVRSYDWGDVAPEGAGGRPVVEISISDNGPGMSEEVRRRATDPFFSTKSSAGGTGLGLAMVESFVSRAAGHMSIYSEPDQGTTIRLRLPRVSAGGDDVGTTRSGAIPRGAGERILLVEDQAGLREPMADLLTELGYCVETAETGVEALTRLEADKPYDLVLSDIVMPGGVSGLDLARKVKARINGLPVILITGFADVSSEEIRRLAVPVLQKPCPVPDLALSIRSALQERKAPAPAET